MSDPPEVEVKDPVLEKWRGARGYQPQSEEDAIALFIANQRPETPGELRAFKTGFSFLFKARSRSLAGFANRIVHNREDAADLAQEVGCRLFRRGGEAGDIRAAGVIGLMYTMVRNLSLDHVRLHENARVDRMVDSSEPAIRFASPIDVERAATESVELSEILTAMEKLRPRDARILQLRLWDELTYAEIGDVVDISAGAATMAYHRALRDLRSLPGFKKIRGDTGGGSPVLL